MTPKTFKRLCEELVATNPDVLFADGFEGALLGRVWHKGLEPIALYDYEKCLEILVRDGMTREEAEEYFHFNVDDAWVGEGTPAFCVIDRSILKKKKPRRRLRVRVVWYASMLSPVSLAHAFLPNPHGKRNVTTRPTCWNEPSHSICSQRVRFDKSMMRRVTGAGWHRHARCPACWGAAERIGRDVPYKVKKRR